MTTLPSGREDVVDEVDQRLAALDRVRDHADRAEQPGVVLGDRDRAGPAEDVGDGEGDGRTRGDGERTAARRSRGRAPGSADWSGVASTRIVSAARAAASRRRAPSPAIADHGQRRSSRSRSRRRWRSSGIVDQARTRSTVASSGSGGTRPASATIETGRVASLAADPRAGRGPQPAVEPDLDQLDPPIEDVGEGGRPPGRRPGAGRPGRRGPRRGAVAERLAGGSPAAGGRREEQLAGPLAGSTAGSIRASWSAIAPARMTVSSGRRATAPVDDRGRARRAGAARRRRADRRRRRGGRRRRGRAGACVSCERVRRRRGVDPRVRQPVLRAAADERLERPDPRRRPRRGSSGRARSGRRAAAGPRRSSPASTSRRRRLRPSARTEARVGGVRPAGSSSVPIASASLGRGEGQRADEPPAVAEPADQRGGRRRGAEVDREEGARIRVTRPCYPARPDAARPDRSPDAVGVRRPR